MEKEKFINVMKRYELKYLVNKKQLDYFINEISSYMQVDKYGLTTICSIYFDTPNYRLINRSIEKPLYKEKLRLRSYGLLKDDSPCFLEIKRKLEGIVYKRRVRLSEQEGMNLILNKETSDKSQISRELEFFMRNYRNLEPKYMIITERVAYYMDNSDLRITIDTNPRYRTNNLNLHTSTEGTPLFDEEMAIIEVKIQHSVPLWLVDILTRGHIYQNSISKVGTAHIKEQKRKSNLLEIQNLSTKGGYEHEFPI